MRSIKRFLLIYLLAGVALATLVMLSGTYWLNNRTINRHMDVQLKQLTHFFSFVITEKPYNNLNNLQRLLNEHNRLEKPHIKKNHSDRFRFQIWNNQGKLLLHSPDGTKARLSSVKNGFTTSNVDGHTWRTYSHYDPRLKVTITIGEQMHFRHHLETTVLFNLLGMLVIVYLLLLILILLIVNKSLFSIKRIAHNLLHRKSSDFTAISDDNVPSEIKPITKALSSLFMRLNNAFERNKKFAADAAHELRTPLAALKMQTQVALQATTETERKTRAKNVLKGVDRCTHIIEQLLTLSRLGQTDDLNDIKLVNFTRTITETIAQLVPNALEKNIEISLNAPKTPLKIYGNEISLSILTRNLIDNAIRYTPQDGSVTVNLFSDNKTITLRVCDTGPGIPEELRERVFDRFFRTLGTKETGSGLGLAIVKQIIDLHHAKAILSTPENGPGLQFDVIFKI